MTEKQKEAIKILNRFKDSMTNEEYFTLLEFVINYKPDIQYIPYYPSTMPTFEELKTMFEQKVTNN